MLTNHLTRNFFKVITLYCCLFFGHFINAQTKGEENSCNASFVIDSGAGFFKTGTHYFKALNQGYENYRWDFGDGSIDSGQSVKHYFPKPGIYPVNLTVFNIHFKTTSYRDMSWGW